MKHLHYVIFDGTSSFIGSVEDVEDNEILFKSKDLDECDDYLENLKS